MDGSIKYIVQLSADARARLETITRNGSAPAKKILHARVLLMSDQHHDAGRYMIIRSPLRWAFTSIPSHASVNNSFFRASSRRWIANCV